MVTGKYTVAIYLSAVQGFWSDKIFCDLHFVSLPVKTWFGLEGLVAFPITAYEQMKCDGDY